MTQAVAARNMGDDFQARLFWLHAALLLQPGSPVRRVGFEIGPKAFDDVYVEYEPSRPPQDHRGHPVLREYFQCKCHVRPGEFGYADLADAAFINAKTQSFLQRAHAAQLGHAPEGRGVRLKLVTNWRLKPDDPLAKLILMQWHALDVDGLFDGTTDASASGRIRKAWREHLNVGDTDLQLVAQILGITQRLESAADVRDRLNDRFAAVGMIQVPPSEAGFFYDDLIAKLHAQKRSDFDRDSFRAMCETEQLIDKNRGKHPVTIGVRSFMHPIDDLASRCDRTLNLVPHFDGRYIRDAAHWNDVVFPELRTFVLEEARATDSLRLLLDTHVSLAFGVGTILNVKSGKAIEIEQRTGGSRFWSPQDEPYDADWPGFAFAEEPVNGGTGDEIAIAISLTHDTAPDVRHYLANLPAVGKLVIAQLTSGPSGISVKCGHHAFLLAESVAARLRAVAAGSKRTHIFMAAPNGFAFFLGQNQISFGASSIYEFDFEGKRGRTYSLGLSVD